MNNLINKIQEYSLEDIMGERFGRYSKSIIQDRALPDVRDGLKPVQRRILYSMFRDKNTHQNAPQKSARSVGSIMGKYHPHGDSSIYEAMVRMSQWWKNNAPYVEMKGNNGSMDGDSPAAMRYTEARLTKIASELLKDIDKDTVSWVKNFDDSLDEPTVLPAKYPNLLVNGASGISAGYATNIPPHNLGEVIDATIARIKNPESTLSDLMRLIKGPDFPTGGICQGLDGIKEAFKTGRGRVIIKSKFEIKQTKGKKQLIIEEIPYEVNKSTLVKKIDDIIFDKKLDGITEVRDESDLKEPMRIVVDMKKDADEELVVNYLLKNTELQVSYSYNMVSIVGKRPVTTSLIGILDAYNNHLKTVITKRTNFELKLKKHSMHITEGLIKLIDILDEVIELIRKSKNKADAKLNLQKKYNFTEIQSEAIVILQLYRLTNTDVFELETAYAKLKEEIKALEKIISSNVELENQMIKELEEIRDEYKTKRKTKIEKEIEEIKIEQVDLIKEEDTIVTLTNDGYVKRCSSKSYSLSLKKTVQTKELAQPILIELTSNLNKLLVFTSLGNYLYLPVHEIPDMKWSDLGVHISNIIQLEPNETIINAKIESKFENNIITIATKLGQIKKTDIKEYDASRYSKPLVAIKLKKEDEVVSVIFGEKDMYLAVTNAGYSLKYSNDEVPTTGIRTSGVKSISLKDDFVIGTVSVTDGEQIIISTSNGTSKRIRVSDIKLMNRGRKGVRIIRNVLTNPYLITDIKNITLSDKIFFQTKTELIEKKSTNISLTDLSSTGNNITKGKIKSIFIDIQDINEQKKEEEIDIIEDDIETLF